MKGTNNSARITRSGDSFAYSGPQDKEAKILDLPAIFRAAATTQDVQLKIVAALSFLEGCLTSFAAAGKDLNEYQTVGLAAICRALTDSADDAYNGQYGEHQIIKALAAGEV